MSAANRTDAFTYRVNFAAAVISDGRTATRSFDNCFENWDGDAVAVALYRRARKNPKLRKNLFRYLSRASVVPLAFKERRRASHNLAAWALELRDTAKAKSDAWLAEIEAKHAHAPA